MDPQRERALELTRRSFFGKSATGIGTLALGSLLSPRMLAEAGGGPHALPKAKRIIYLCQSGAPSQLDLFDYKPGLQAIGGKELPDSVRKGQRLTGMTSTQASLPIAAPIFDFAQHGESGAWVSELLPHTAAIADDLCFIKTLYTEAINHDPAITMLQTGAQLAGRPSMGAWLSYGLGSDNEDLPTFVAMTSGDGGQPLYDRLWGSGFLPTKHQGVKFRRSGDPVLYLSNPPGVDAVTRREQLDDLAGLNRVRLAAQGDPEIATRIAQYELAYRMQTSVPELTDLSGEPEEVMEMYGPDAKKPGSFTAAMEAGMDLERKAAVLVTTKRPKRSGVRVATPIPMAPPQSWTTRVISFRPRCSTSCCRLSTCCARRYSQSWGLSESPQPM